MFYGSFHGSCSVVPPTLTDSDCPAHYNPLTYTLINYTIPNCLRTSQSSSCERVCVLVCVQVCVLVCCKCVLVTGTQDSCMLSSVSVCKVL